jgi:hypothetical protein
MEIMKARSLTQIVLLLLIIQFITIPDIASSSVDYFPPDHIGEYLETIIPEEWGVAYVENARPSHYNVSGLCPRYIFSNRNHTTNVTDTHLILYFIEKNVEYHYLKMDNQALKTPLIYNSTDYVIFYANTNASDELLNEIFSIRKTSTTNLSITSHMVAYRYQINESKPKLFIDDDYLRMWYHNQGIYEKNITDLSHWTPSNYIGDGQDIIMVDDEYVQVYFFHDEVRIRGVGKDGTTLYDEVIYQNQQGYYIGAGGVQFSNPSIAQYGDTYYVGFIAEYFGDAPWTGLIIVENQDRTNWTPVQTSAHIYGPRGKFSFTSIDSQQKNGEMGLAYETKPYQQNLKTYVGRFATTTDEALQSVEPYKFEKKAEIDGINPFIFQLQNDTYVIVNSEGLWMSDNLSNWTKILAKSYYEPNAIELADGKIMIAYTTNNSGNDDIWIDIIDFQGTNDDVIISDEQISQSDDQDIAFAFSMIFIASGIVIIYALFKRL